EVLAADATEDDVFDAVRDDVVAALHGEAVYIFAHGARGSGKTHTVGHIADRVAQELERQRGPLAGGGGGPLRVGVQAVEVRREQVRDLFAGRPPRPLFLFALRPLAGPGRPESHRALVRWPSQSEVGLNRAWGSRDLRTLQFALRGAVADFSV
ncbi:unnamed protein product, partial [Prorocentrum cordatum]